MMDAHATDAPKRAARLTASLIRSAVVASLGGLLFGMETAVISGANDWLKLHFELSAFWLGFTVASALIGTIVGSIAVGRAADAMGRRGVLVVLAALFCISALGCSSPRMPSAKGR